MPFDVKKKERITLEQLSDEQNAILSRLAYKDLQDGWYKVDTQTGGPQTLYNLMLEVDKDLAVVLNQAGLGDLVIKDYINKNDKYHEDDKKGNGFCAIAFEDPYTGDVGMSMRGTEGLEHFNESLKKGLAEFVGEQKDMLDNGATAAFGTSPQVREALDFYQKNKDKDGKNYLYGHSKGGEVVAELYVYNYEGIAGAHVVNAQPINPWKLSLGQLEALHSKKFDAVVIDGDIVSWLGTVAYPVRVVKDKFPDDGLFGSHAPESMEVDDFGMAKPEKNPYSGDDHAGLYAFIAHKVLTGVQKHLIPAAVATGVIMRVGDFLINDLPEKVRKFVDNVKKTINAITTLSVKTKEFLTDFIVELVNKVSVAFKMASNPGYRYAVTHPLIKVDPYKLRNYADRLKHVNQKLVNIDRRLDSLYAQAGFLDLLSLLQADLLMSESTVIKRVISYLEETANDFEAVDRKIRTSF